MVRYQSISRGLVLKSVAFMLALTFACLDAAWAGDLLYTPPTPVVTQAPAIVDSGAQVTACRYAPAYVQDQIEKHAAIVGVRQSTDDLAWASIAE